MFTVKDFDDIVKQTALESDIQFHFYEKGNSTKELTAFKYMLNTIGDKLKWSVNKMMKGNAIVYSASAKFGDYRIYIRTDDKPGYHVEAYDNKNDKTLLYNHVLSESKLKTMLKELARKILNKPSFMGVQSNSILSHDKSFWEGKQRYVDRRNKENMEIDSLTDEQHLAIQSICSMRHDLHTFGAKALYCSESSDNKEYSRYLFNDESVSFGDGEIDRLIKENDLPSISWSDEVRHYYLYELPCDDYEYLEEQYEYDKEDYQKGKLNPKIDGKLKKAIEEDLDYDDAQDKYFISEDYYSLNIETWSDFLEIVNKDIENWLLEIDRIYGTHYCPTGHARAKLYGSALMSAGYYGYSMSNNARDAYLDGEMPLSKWSKRVILEVVEELRPDLIESLKIRSVQTLREKLLYQSSWHHTSKMYNKTDFYSIDEDFLENLTEEDIENWSSNQKGKQFENELKKNSSKEAYDFYDTHVKKQQNCIFIEGYYYLETQWRSGSLDKPGTFRLKLDKDKKQLTLEQWSGSEELGWIKY